MTYFTRKFTLFVLLILASSLACSDDMAAIRASLIRIEAGLTAQEINSTPMPGIYRVQLSPTRTIYMSTDGKFFFSGDMYQNSNSQGLQNLTQLDQQRIRRGLLATVSDNSGWMFAPTGKPKAVITVFTDVDCYYCQKLHQEIKQINDLGIAVHYLAFPRAGIGSDAYAQIASAWCADDRNEAITTAKIKAQNGGLSESPYFECDHPVTEHYELGKMMGITGTPAIVTQAGLMIPGYLPAAALAERLNLL
jgi:thiol:disulfide interchange protein DsbC